MTHDEIAGYTLLAGYALLLLGAIRVFGLKRVLLVILGIVIVGVVRARVRMRAITDRRY